MHFYFRSCTICSKMEKADFFIACGNFSRIFFGSMSCCPLWSAQKWSSSQASGSPQSQQPPAFLLSWTLWPVWSPFSKHSLQIIQVGSFSQSIHLQHTSPQLICLAQTPYYRSWLIYTSIISYSSRTSVPNNSIKLLFRNPFKPFKTLCWV